MNDKPEIKSIAIMRTSALGDVVWTVPLIRCLQRNFPSSEITIFIDPLFSPVIDEIKGIKIVEINKPKSLKDYLRLRRKLKEFEFDILLCTQTSLRINLLYPMIKAKRKIGFDSERASDGHRFFINESIPFKQEHSLDGLLGFAKYLGCEDNAVEFNLPISDESKAWFKNESLNENIIVIHPKASSVQRTGSPKFYGELIDMIQEKFTHQVLITGAGGDIDLVNEITSHCKKAPKTYCGKTNLKQLAALLSHASLVIAPDSGPIHLAQASGAKTLGLYAAVPPEYTGPYEQTENCVNAYPQAVEKFLGIEPAQVPWRTRIKFDGIMDLISVDQVIKKMTNILN